MSTMKFCPDCTKPMDVISLLNNGEYHVCGNVKCDNYTPPKTITKESVND